MPIQNITELFALDGRDFVTQAYRNLLNREPDPHGMAYYLGRLSMGYGKAGVIAQLAKSPECRPHEEIKGLKKLVADERRASHWFFGLFGGRSRMERALHGGLAELSHIRQHLESLHGAVLAQAQQTGELVKQLAQWQAIAVAQTQNATEEPRLPAETVRQLYREILGREPENDEVIQTHAKLGTVEALREVLLNSEEFQSRIAGLPEYARTLMKRCMQVCHAQQEAV
ncbi:MAG: DUF4214 domain-containing protein [Acidithiobacillus caldus]|uniref:DUF4214 domain-containing protein n=1 Tax=Acidithiobacillus caldus TaxID=33059 RepID=UPI002815FCE6|nr:DUF4214 domain-containing protein [Acidithiobacillus caldus]WMT47190.1 MAG: DUF4214 domain-containing protein [Acidithiobacillus caldus]